MLRGLYFASDKMSNVTENEKKS